MGSGMLTVSEITDGEVSATAGLDTLGLAARFFVVVIVTLRDKNDSANEANFLAPHRSISHLQHAPSHLQRQAFLEQIAWFLRKFFAIKAVDRLFAPKPNVDGKPAIFVPRGDVLGASEARMTRSCGRV
jgi:hypothetical protein